MSQHAIENAQSWFNNICEMVEKFQEAEARFNDGKSAGYLHRERLLDEARETIEESPLSVQVRSGWYAPGAETDSRGQPRIIKPAEYEILLTTGGPALRIIGELSEHGQPENARLQWQDWGTPWTDLHMSELLLHQPSEITPSKADEILLAFASVFYFGE